MIPSPPKHLDKEGRRLWRTITTDFDLEPRSLVVLQVACEAIDRLTQARQALTSSLTVEDHHGRVSPKPEVQIEKDCAIRLLRALRELGLDTAIAEEFARPARIQGGKRYA